MNKRRINFGFDRFSGIYLWILFIAVFSIWIPGSFLTPGTIHSVASAQAISGIIALSLLVPMACGHFDLSVGSNANFAGIVAVIVQDDWHWSVGVAVVFAVAIGVAIGVVNGFVVIRLGVNSFIATLGMGSILSAFLVIVTASLQPNPPTSTAWSNLTQWTVGGFQVVVVYLIALGLVIWWFLDFTPAGRYIYASGANPDAARLSGVRVNRWALVSLMISGGLAALGGVLFTSLTGPDLAFGASLLLPAFAAVFLGSTQLQPGRFNVWGTLLAIYVLATGVLGLQLVSGQQWLDEMFNGVALIVAVALSVNRRGASSGRSRKRSTKSEAVPSEIPATSDTEPSFAQPREQPH